MIILFPDDAQKVLGISPTHPYSALEPVPLKDGTYQLHEDVMHDPAHVDVLPILQACDIMLDTGLIDFDQGTPGNPMPPVEKAAYDAAKLDYIDAGVRTDGAKAI